MAVANKPAGNLGFTKTRTHDSSALALPSEFESRSSPIQDWFFFFFATSQDASLAAMITIY